jgi:hypothetical protein
MDFSEQSCIEAWDVMRSPLQAKHINNSMFIRGFENVTSLWHHIIKNNNNKNGENCIHMAVKANSLECLQLIFKYSQRTDINARNFDGKYYSYLSMICTVSPWSLHRMISIIKQLVWYLHNVVVFLMWCCNDVTFPNPWYGYSFLHFCWPD